MLLAPTMDHLWNRRSIDSKPENFKMFGCILNSKRELILVLATVPIFLTLLIKFTDKESIH